MRKIFKSFMLVAAAAMAFASCQKEEKVAPETISATLTMHADIEATKTYLGEDNTVFWGTDEAVTLYVGSGETAKFFDSASTDAYDGEASASFTFAMEGVTEADSYALGGIYPASAAMDDNKNATQYKVILPATQNQVDGNYDPSAYIMVLKPEIVDVLPTEYTASFRRATALNKVTLTNVAEDITSVEITVPAEKYLAGRRYFDLTTGDSGEVYYDKSSTISVNSAFTGNSIDVWFCSWGVELAAGEELTITMKSATKSYTRTITANENGIRFVEGDLNTLKINMASATVEDTGDFSGEWLITGTTSDATYAAKAYSTGNNLSSPVQITVAEDGSIDEVDGLDMCKMTFTKMIEGEYEGMYTIQDASGNYLYAASSSANQLKGGASANSAHYYWTVECKDGAYSIIASKSTNRNVMQFNPNNGTPIFNCYASASQTAVVLYPYSNVKPDTTPRITVEDTEYNVSADDETLEFSYNTKNIDGNPTVSVADGATMTNVEADAEAGIVTVIFDANAEEVEKTATLVLSYEGAESVSVTITQAAKAAEGAAYYEKVTSAPADSDWSGTYLIVANTNVATVIEGTWLKFASVEINDNKIESTDIIDAYAVTIEKVSSQSYYTIKLANGQYLGTPSSNSIKQNASAGTDFYWKFSLADDLVKIEANAYSGRILRLNGTSGFRTYTSTTGTQATLYKLIGGEETPEPELQERNLAFSSTTATATVGEDFTEPTLNGATAGVTYSSSNTSVAIVNETTGAVTLVAAGETTISATAAADATYKAGEASYTLTVSAAQGGGDEGGETTGGYTLITSLSDITTGQYVIAAKVNGTYYAMSNVFASKINGTSVTVTDNAISESVAVNYVVTITKNGTSFSISSGTEYLTYKSSTNLGTQTTAYNWTISEGVNGTFRATSETSGRGILYRAGNYNQFGGYSLGNATSTSTEYFDIELFKLN